MIKLTKRANRMYITIKNYFSKEPSLRVVVCMIISMDIFLLSILKNVRKAINISIWYNNLEEFNFGEIRMKTWMKLVFLSLIAVVLVACEGLHIKIKGIKMTEELKTDSVWIDVHHGEKVTLNPYDAVTAVYHFEIEYIWKNETKDFKLLISGSDKRFEYFKVFVSDKSPIFRDFLYY